MRTPEIKLAFIFCLLLNTPLNAQKKSPAVYTPMHRISVNLAHAHIRQGINSSGGASWMALAAWGLDYHYLFKEKFRLGVQADWVPSDFKVKAHFSNEPENVIRRNHPISLCASFGYKAAKNVTLLLGSGSEYAPEETLYVTTFGAEYGFDLPGNLELGAGLTYALKWSAYDTWFLSFIVSKKFVQKKK